MHVVSKKRYQFEWKHLFGVTCPSKTYIPTYICIPSCAETQMMGWLSTYLEEVATLVTEHPRIVPSCYLYKKNACKMQYTYLCWFLPAQNHHNITCRLLVPILRRSHLKLQCFVAMQETLLPASKSKQ